MKKAKAMKLVKALRSGEYEQGRGNLVDSADRFCCLGVACNVSTLPLEWERVGNTWRMGGTSVDLPDQIQDEYGFFNSSGTRRDGQYTKIRGGHYDDLVDANDSGASFEDIADYIEKNWEML